MNNYHQTLRVDTTGLPLEWVDYKEAAKLYAVDQVVYTLGKNLYTIYGGINAVSGEQSSITVNSIIATSGRTKHFQDKMKKYTPPLNNQTLFKRDSYLCMYCGIPHNKRELTRDHITPISQGGKDNWNNVVSACKRCNHHKGGRTPEQAKIELLAIPFVPNYAEYIYLQGRNILADQMDFLLGYIPKTSPIHHRIDLEKETPLV
jgi:hypothetical protein|tara:strand:- start:1898 stop:2509 length:612 start_codon:yes stop_codon:yes gene_type:complete